MTFFMWLDIHRSNIFIGSFQVVMVRHARTCPKLCQIVSQLHLENELRYKKLAFSMWLWIHGSSKFVHSFQVGTIRHTQSQWKQWYLSEMNIDNSVLHLNLFFACGINKYIYMIQSIYMGVVRRTWACPR